MDFKRTFIGIPLPEVLRDRLDAIRRELMPISKGLVWVRPELMHITIKFLERRRNA
ncbi:MAG: 2'-5' RNA ligase family protein [Candidatus Neomarinimicrobiota bacterium]|jgi:2'-5' RNA ligase